MPHERKYKTYESEGGTVEMNLGFYTALAAWAIAIGIPIFLLSTIVISAAICAVPPEWAQDGLCNKEAPTPPWAWPLLIVLVTTMFLMIPVAIAGEAKAYHKTFWVIVMEILEANCKESQPKKCSTCGQSIMERCPACGQTVRNTKATR